jgi:uncharacterized membrane protein
MTLAPLAATTPVIQIHVAATLLALVSGSAVMLLPKGTALHRRIGWVFAAAMAVVAASSLFIMSKGHFSAIHLFTVLVAVNLPYAIIMRRRGIITAHKWAMIGLFAGLVGAGAFTVVPGRLMHQVTCGQGPAAP